MITDRPLSVLETLDGYRISFMNVDLWRPWIQEISREWGRACNEIRAGTPGSFPTFIVDEEWVIKFFGPLFDGGTCWKVEQEATKLMQEAVKIPVAGLLWSGVLEEEPGWQYLVFEYVPGTSIKETIEMIPFEEKVMLGRGLGEWLSAMHAITKSKGSSLPSLSRALMQGWFSNRWAEGRAQWPNHLACQVEDYLLENEKFLQASADTFIHADLTQDHLLGTLKDGHWTTRAIIDFGDAMWGNIYYELTALHLDLFEADKRILKACLEAYGLRSDPDFSRKAMVTSLMHQFDVYGYYFTQKNWLRDVKSIGEMTELLWDING